jgi:hypothetical protein
MEGIEMQTKLAQEEIGVLDRAYQEKEYGELKSLILRLDLDKLLLDYPEEAQLITQRKTEFMEVERGTLTVIGNVVLDDVEYQQKSLQWETMTYDQMQTEKELLKVKFDELKDYYNTQSIANEEALMPLLSWEATILSLIPVLFISGTILTQISAFRRYGKKD